MMVDELAKFKSFPKSVRYGIILLVAGWLWNYLSLYLFFEGNVPWQQIVLGVTICFFVFKIKKWARVLCFLGNSFIILQYMVASWGFYGQGQMQNFAISMLNIIVFAAASYFLAIKETSRFFDEYNQK
jgi:hypothetical protein